MIKRIEEFDVKIVLNSKVQDVLEAKAAGKFDAVFVAIGAHLAKHVDIPARDATKVFDAVALRDVGTGGKRVLGRRVVIYGGGNTAMDAARTAKRLGVARTDGSRFHPATESVSEACIKFDDPAHVVGRCPGPCCRLRREWLAHQWSTPHTISRPEIERFGRPSSSSSTGPISLGRSRYRESTSKPIEAGQYVAALPESAKKSGVRG